MLEWLIKFLEKVQDKSNKRKLKRREKMIRRLCLKLYSENAIHRYRVSDLKDVLNDKESFRNEYVWIADCLRGGLFDETF